MSQMRKSCYAFFGQERLKEKPRLEKQLRGEYFGAKNWYDLFERNARMLVEEIEAEPLKSAEDYFRSYQVSLSIYHRPETVKIAASCPNFNKAIDDLSRFYILENLKLGCELKTRAYFLSDISEVPLLKEVMKKAEEFELVEVKIYKKFIELLEDDSDKQYQETKNFFFENLDELQLEDQMNLFTVLLNLTGRIALRGKSGYFKELFLLQGKGLENDFFITNGFMPAYHFSNIAFNGIVLGELDWARSFISKYDKSLLEEEKKVVVNLCMARIEMEENNFLSAFQYLNEIEKVQHKFSFKIRSLFIRCLYELYLIDDKYYDLLTSRILSFERFIQRDTTWGETKKASHLKFCSVLTRCMNVISTNDNEEIQKLNDELQKQPAIMNDWLIDKMNQSTKQ